MDINFFLLNISPPTANPIAVVLVPITMGLNKVHLYPGSLNFLFFQNTSPPEDCHSVPLERMAQWGVAAKSCFSTPAGSGLNSSGRHTTSRSHMLTFHFHSSSPCFQHSKVSQSSQDAMPSAIFFFQQCPPPTSSNFYFFFKTAPHCPLCCPHLHKALITQNCNPLSLSCGTGLLFISVCLAQSLGHQRSMNECVVFPVHAFNT